MQNYNQLSVPQKITLQRLTPAEWALWRHLRLRALKEAPYAFGSKLEDWQGAGDMEERWRERLASVPLNIVALINDVPVGMVSATEQDENAIVELISLWVTPSGRGCNVGDILVEAVIQWAARQRASIVSLDVTVGNQHAVELYLRHGFVEMGRLIPHSPEDTPELRFLRKL